MFSVLKFYFLTSKIINFCFISQTTFPLIYCIQNIRLTNFHYEKPVRPSRYYTKRLFPIFAPEMKNTYPKSERLKSKYIIDALFSKGKSVSKYPLRLVYMPLEACDEPIKMGVSVSKKHFKKAVDRNYFKRVLRETYRLNKHLLLDNTEKPYAYMFMYQSKDRLSYEEINTKTLQLFEKFVATIHGLNQ